MNARIPADIREDLKTRFHHAAVWILDRWKQDGLMPDSLTPVRQIEPAEQVAVNIFGKLLNSVDEIPDALIDQAKHYDDLKGVGSYHDDVAKVIQYIEPNPSWAPKSATEFLERLLNPDNGSSSSFVVSAF